MREKKNSVPFMDADIATAPWGRKKLIVTKFSKVEPKLVLCRGWHFHAPFEGLMD